jgi:LysR family pca operon transcriptional activator
MDIKPRYLLHLAAIGEHGSFVRAARHLRISQPALSLSVQRIEDITRVKLVDRGRYGARLTPAGKQLARRGAEVGVSVSSAAVDVELLSRGISGILRIGGTPLSTNSIIPQVISRILSVTNDVSINVIEGLDEDLLELLNRNELDIVIGAPGTLASRPAFDTSPLFSANTVLVVRPGHPLLDQTAVSLADLENVLWAIPPKGGAFRNQIEALFTVNGITFPQRTVQASSIHVLKRIVRLSDAVTLAAKQIVLEELELGQLSYLNVSEPIAVRVFGLHTRRNRELGDLGKRFCELAVELSANYDMQ